MNEKIRKLAEQAGARKNSVCYGHGDYRTELQLSNDNIEKFAELIVQECAEIAIDVSEGLTVATAIRKHFGIEE